MQFPQEPNVVQPLWRRIGTFVAPMITGNVLQLLTGTATAAMLGRLVDASSVIRSQPV